jgi:single-strand DNA-binding protein
MSFTIKGILHKIFETEQKTESFSSREFVIETLDEKYPQFIKFQLTQDRCGLIDNFKEGEEITVHFDLRGREWNEKYFTNLNAWRIEGAEQTATEVVSSEDAPLPDKAAANIESVGGGDLPF